MVEKDEKPAAKKTAKEPAKKPAAVVSASSCLKDLDKSKTLEELINCGKKMIDLKKTIKDSEEKKTLEAGINDFIKRATETISNSKDVNALESSFKEICTIEGHKCFSSFMLALSKATLKVRAKDGDGSDMVSFLNEFNILNAYKKTDTKYFGATTDPTIFFEENCKNPAESAEMIYKVVSERMQSKTAALWLVEAWRLYKENPDCAELGNTMNRLAELVKKRKTMQKELLSYLDIELNETWRDALGLDSEVPTDEQREDEATAPAGSLSKSEQEKLILDTVKAALVEHLEIDRKFNEIKSSIEALRQGTWGGDKREAEKQEYQAEVMRRLNIFVDNIKSKTDEIPEIKAFVDEIKSEVNVIKSSIDEYHGQYLEELNLRGQRLEEAEERIKDQYKKGALEELVKEFLPNLENLAFSAAQLRKDEDENKGLIADQIEEMLSSLQQVGIHQIGRPSEIVDYDPIQHRAGGRKMSIGEPAEIATPGWGIEYGEKREVVAKALVVGIEKGE